MTTTRTYRLSGKRIQRAWHVIDAGGRPLGRVASEAAQLLLGKHKPDYEPHLPMGDHVIIVNAKDVAVTGNKTAQKIYYRHSGYPGGLRERRLFEQLEKDPRKVLERAVRGMLPHNALGRELFRHLKVYAGAEHPHEAQVKAGTGARARKRAAQADRPAAPKAEAPRPQPAPEPAAAAEEAPAVAAATAAGADVAGGATAAEASERDLRLTGSLARHKRDELDAEAARLGIEVEEGWKKDDVAAAIQTYYEEHPIEGEE